LREKRPGTRSGIPHKRPGRSRPPPRSFAEPAEARRAKAPDSNGPQSSQEKRAESEPSAVCHPAIRPLRWKNTTVQRTMSRGIVVSRTWQLIRLLESPNGRTLGELEETLGCSRRTVMGTSRDSKTRGFRSTTSATDGKSAGSSSTASPDSLSNSLVNPYAPPESSVATKVPSLAGSSCSAEPGLRTPERRTRELRASLSLLGATAAQNLGGPPDRALGDDLMRNLARAHVPGSEPFGRSFIVKYTPFFEP
jgi:hypothetical protein